MSDIETDATKVVHKSSVRNQFIAAFIVNLLAINYGMTIGWSSPNIELLASNKTPLPSGKMNQDETSWIASLICVGAFIGNLFFGHITNIWGRKLPLIFISIPAIISWFLIWFAQNVYYLYAARILGGIVGGGTVAIVPLFLTEIASDRFSILKTNTEFVYLFSVRGIIGSTFVFTINTGFLVALVLGSFCHFYVTPQVVIVIMAIYILLVCLLPESPLFLVKKNEIVAAEKSIKFYQNIRGTTDYDHKLLQFEMEKLKILVSYEIETCKSNESLSIWSNLTSGPARKALMIGTVLASLTELDGGFAMLNYTATIFKEAGSNLTPNMSSIIVGIIQLLGSFPPTILVERAGRKLLYVVSTIGTALGLITLGVYTMSKSWNYPVESFNWLPIASFSFVNFVGSIAIATLPFLVISEIMPQNIKEFGATFCTSIMWICSFVSVKYLPLLINLIEFHGTMFLFAGVCLASTVFILIFVPETKGKSYDEIQMSLR